MSSLATPPPVLLNPALSEKSAQETSEMDRRNLHLPVKPSSLLKSAAINRSKPHSGIREVYETRLAAEDFRLQRLRTLHRSSSFRAAAEEDLCLKEQKELQILMLASQKGLNWTSLEPQFALALGRAVRDTLTAEEELAKRRVIECENLLATLKDKADDARARTEDAHHQIGSVLVFYNTHGVPINLQLDSLQDPPPLSSDMTLSSDIESISDYDSSSCDSESTSNPCAAPVEVSDS